MNRRASVLREMGLAPLWRLRDAPAAAEYTPPAQQHAAAAGVSEAADVAAAPVREPVGVPAAAARPAVMPTASPLVAPAPARVATDGLGWDELEAAIGACRACPLHERRTMAVPGVGDRAADWLFVGEGPGAEEDLRGEPFVGQAGKLLDAMLAAIGLVRGRNVYIANAVKCRPPGNRTPQAVEMTTCQPYLERQIELIQPRIIVALGRPAAQTLLGGEVKINAARGRLFDRAGIPVVVTYHPAYLLRSPQDKAKAWEDLCFARAALAPR
ncbi:MAG: uracil-DNA glycosylase [Methyloversatilis sp.]|uniref:uracil-DNA glycosylase n=1 Tax=Methyloversatilis sp. TaxID=2569862 RepID=UPI0027359294|nr:uracil-DNA glycosylase [Methyloversatilis sp.]MDP3874232.1 uracil-DNA glycosylase [Methyloversatilis sp.]